MEQLSRKRFTCKKHTSDLIVTWQEIILDIKKYTDESKTIMVIVIEIIRTIITSTVATARKHQTTTISIVII